MQMIFEVQPRGDWPPDGTTVYRTSKQAFEAVGETRESSTSLRLGGLSLEIDAGGKVLHPRGPAPRDAWGTTTRPPPRARGGALRIRGFSSEPGVPASLGSADVWPILLGAGGTWVCVGDPTCQTEIDAVEFWPGTIAVVQDAQLRALWMRFAEVEDRTAPSST